MDISEISDREVAELTRELVAIPSPNPPGDVGEVAEHVVQYLKKNHINTQVFRPADQRVNIIATVDSGVPGSHVVWSGHLDTFPLNHETKDLIRDLENNVYGRGVSDMKGGVAGYLVALSKFRQHLGSFKGKISLVLVCDEETFGPHGLESLAHLDSIFQADYVLTSEPSGRGIIRHGERGPVWGSVKFASPAGHGAYTNPNKVNAIVSASNFVKDINLNFTSGVVHNVRTYDGSVVGENRDPGESFSLNIGKISGGTKVNMMPTHCVVEIDIRIPFGVETNALTSWVSEKAAEHGGIFVSDVAAPGNISDPHGTLFKVMSEVVEEIIGYRPDVGIARGSTDLRHWRYKGIPAGHYGADSLQQATSGEFVSIKELGEIARIHALTTLRLLSEEVNDD